MIYFLCIEPSTSLGITGELYSNSMAVVDGSFNFMDDTSEPVLGKLDRSHCSSYDPSPINISTEAATTISTSEPKGPKQKKAKVAKKLLL